jgi:hypothetical protein
VPHFAATGAAHLEDFRVSEAASITVAQRHAYSFGVLFERDRPERVVNEPAALGGSTASTRGKYGSPLLRTALLVFVYVCL